MLQYLIILLDDSSTSYCYYNSAQERKLIPLQTLKKGIKFGMMHNLMIQFVYPNYRLPEEYLDTIETIDHSNIKPYLDDTDALIVSNISGIESDVPVVWRTTLQNMLGGEQIIVNTLKHVPRLNIVVTDIELFGEKVFTLYQQFLERLSIQLDDLYNEGYSCQLNLLTDRIMLEKMNNCGAGISNITLAPNGKFYICPAFYYENDVDNVGDLNEGIIIKNQRLYQYEYAPICKHCDAYHCKRCVWLNRKTTLEVNTPSHEQCTVSHIERNISRDLLLKCRINNNWLSNYKDISEIKYLDPFMNRKQWEQENL